MYRIHSPCCMYHETTKADVERYVETFTASQSKKIFADMVSQRQDTDRWGSLTARRLMVQPKRNAPGPLHHLLPGDLIELHCPHKITVENELLQVVAFGTGFDPAADESFRMIIKTYGGEEDNCNGGGCPGVFIYSIKRTNNQVTGYYTARHTGLLPAGNIAMPASAGRAVNAAIKEWNWSFLLNGLFDAYIQGPVTMV